MLSQEIFDVVIVGAGPAGMSAALTLGRCRRKVLLCDRGTPRNLASKEMHGFLTRDVIKPEEFAAAAHRDLQRYPSVTYIKAEVFRARKLEAESGFELSLNTGDTRRARKLLLATGLFDELPAIPEIDSYFGKSVFNCPYCDGWEFRELPLLAYGSSKKALEMARALTAWSSKVRLCCHDAHDLQPEDFAALAEQGIELFESPIRRLYGEDGQLSAVECEDGRQFECRAIFFDTSCRQQSSLARELGCHFSEDGGIQCGRYEATDVPGLYAAGNATKDVQLAIVAAAEGARAAVGINKDLTREAFYARPRASQAPQRPSSTAASTR